MFEIVAQGRMSPTSSRTVLLLCVYAVAGGCLGADTKHRFYGNAYAQRGEHEKAIVEYETVLADHPDDAVALCLLGHSLFELERLDQAERAYRRALRVDRDHGDAHFGLALLLARRGASDDAALHFEAVVRQNPRDLTSLTNLGRLYLASGKLDLAQSKLERALSVKPDDVPASFVLGRVQIEQGRHEDARRTFRALARVAPGEAYAQYGMAALEAHRGNRSEALRLLRLALDKGVDDVGAIRRDRSFRSLKTDPELVSLLGRYERSRTDDPRAGGR